MNMRLATFLFFLIAALGCADTPVALLSADSARQSERLEVYRGRFSDVIYLTGEVESAGGDTIVVPRIPNWQTSIKSIVDEGTRVESGDVVAELDSTQFSSGLDEKRQSVIDAEQSIAQQEARIEAEITQKEFDLEQKRVDHERAKRNAEIPRSILPLRDYEENQLSLRRSKTEYDKALTDLESQRGAGHSELANYRLDLSKTRREVRIAEAAIDALVLRASTGGVVSLGENGRTGRKFQVGDTVWVGQKIAVMPDLDSLRVEATLFDVDDGRIASGLPVTVVVDAYPESTFEGSVDSIRTVAEALTNKSLRRGFGVTINLEDADRERLRPGYSVRAAVMRSELAEAILVPREAVDFSTSPPRVATPGGFADTVRLGECNAQACVVEQGLEVGDVVRRTAGDRR